MPFNGSGTFTIVNTFVPGTTILSSLVNQNYTDIATGLSTTILKNGTQIVTADIPMASHKFTGLSAGSANGDSVRFEQASVLLASGTVSAAATLDLVLTNYTAWRGLRFVLSGFLPATDGAQLYMRFSTDGGATYLASGYNYATAIASDASAVSGAGSGSASQITMTGSIGNAATEGINSEVTILNQTATTFWPRITHNSYYIDSAGTPGAWFTIGGGSHESAIDVDAVRFLFSSGNIANGNYAVIGIP